MMLVPSALFAQREKAAKPNFVIFIADDVSLNDIGCYGNPTVKTPHIDSLADQGLRFTNVYLTTSSSSPSRASILTGRYPHNTGACELHSSMTEEQVTIAEVLHNNGYYTAQAGKWHIGSPSAAVPQGPALRGFDRTGGSSKDGGGNSGAGRWVEWLRERPADKPFFMWFASHDAHRTWDDDQSLPRYNPSDIIVPDIYVDNPKTRKDLASYYYEVSRFDSFVGKAINELKREGVLENTCIIIMADNGRPFPQAKTRLISEGIKTPFIVCFPQKTARPATCDALVSVIDIAPTIAALADVRSPESFQGKSFEKSLSHPERKFRHWVFAEHNWHDFEACERMVSDGKRVYIENYRPELNAEGASDIMNGATGQSLLEGHRTRTLTDWQNEIFVAPREKEELFRSGEDGNHRVNIASDHPQAAKKMRAVLNKWRSQTCDTCPSELTHDWYSRDDMSKTADYHKRGEMPGASENAATCGAGGPF